MPYYHVYIDRDSDEAEETDFSKEQLMKHIVKPYSQRKEFMCRGSIIDPYDVTTIRIIETEQPSSKLLPEIKAERGMLAQVLVHVSDVLLLEGKGRDVTREFIKTKEARQKKIARKKTLVPLSKNVFIVHGKDQKPMEELKAMLKEFGLNPIVLHEQPSGSMTIVEKLEKYSDVGYVFVLLTPDDALVPTIEFKVDEKHGTITPTYIYNPPPIFRARQNVILEFGFFVAKVGRNKVCCLYKENTQLPYDLPSDMHGIVYISFKESISEKKDMIIKELREADYEIRL
jgi:predicted nucleotide-binding protein